MAKAPRVLFSLVCDDIRHEVGNKVSLMGIYNDAILVPEIPRIFPKLCVHQRWVDLPAKGELKIGIKGPGFNLPILAVEFEKGPLGPVLRAEDSVDFSLAFANVQFTLEGEYKVIAFLDNNEHKPDYEKTFIVKKFIQP